MLGQREGVLLSQNSSSQLLAHTAALQVEGGWILLQQFTTCPLPQLDDFCQAYSILGPLCSHGANCIKDLGAFVSCLLLPLEVWEPRVQGQLLRLAWSSPQSRVHRAATEAGHSLTLHIHTSPSPHHHKGSFLHGQNGSPKGAPPQPAAQLLEQEPCHPEQLPRGQLMAWCSYRQREETWE